MEPKTTESTREYIMQSLALLIQKKPYASITMEDVSQKSGMSRRTLYRYFDNKTAILRAYVDGLLAEFWPYVTDSIRSGKNIVENSFDFIDLHFEFFKAAYNNELLFNIIDLLKQVIRQIALYSPPENRDPAYIDHYVAYVAGGCWGLLSNWLSADKKQSSHEMALAYKQIARDLDERLSKT